MVLHKPGPASNCLNVSVFRKTKQNKLSMNLRYFLGLNRAEGLFSGRCIYILCEESRWSVQRAIYTTPLAGQEGEGSRGVSPICH